MWALVDKKFRNFDVSLTINFVANYKSVTAKLIKQLIDIYIVVRENLRLNPSRLVAEAPRTVSKAPKPLKEKTRGETTLR